MFLVQTPLKEMYKWLACVWNDIEEWFHIHLFDLIIYELPLQKIYV